MSEIEFPAGISAQQEIDLYRAEIGAIDEKILTLLNQRFVNAKHIGLVKKRISAQVFQPSREHQLVRDLCRRNEGPLDSVHVRSIWGEIFRASRYIQNAQPVAYLGPIGTYTQDAMLAHFGVAHESLPCETIDAVFTAVMDGRAGYGVVPIENSTEGTINRALDLVFEKGLQISGEVVLPVSHCLMSQSGTASGIECVIGHEQALAQCRRWLDTHFPGVQRRAVSSNAQAAKLAAESAGNAAIGSRRAAGHYGLHIVAASIQDEHCNSTRFYIVGRDQPAPSGDDRTLLCVELNNSPGALLRLLGPAAERSIPVTRIDSRPLKSELWAYRFFLELPRHRHDPDLASALQEMNQVANSLVVLGSYPTALNISDTGFAADLENLNLEVESCIRTTVLNG